MSTNKLQRCVYIFTYFLVNKLGRKGKFAPLNLLHARIPSCVATISIFRHLLSHLIEFFIILYTVNNEQWYAEVTEKCLKANKPPQTASSSSKPLERRYCIFTNIDPLRHAQQFNVVSGPAGGLWVVFANIFLLRFVDCASISEWDCRRGSVSRALNAIDSSCVYARCECGLMGRAISYKSLPMEGYNGVHQFN